MSRDMTVDARTPAAGPAAAPARPRVLFLVKQLALGGAERTIVTLAGRLRGEWDVHVAYFHGHDALRGELADLGVPLVEVAGRPGAANALRRLHALLRALRPDVVNAHDAYSAILARLAGAATRVPVVTTLQLVASAYRPQVRAADRLTSALLGAGTIAISREVEREWLDTPLARAMRRTPGVVIGNPVDGAAADAAAATGRDEVRRRLGLPPDAILATNVGRYVAQKAQDRLLDAMALLAPRHPSLRLLIVGYGVLEDALRRQAIRLGLTDRVHFLVHRLDALEIVAASDVFVFPSRYEGLGVAPLEAMWMGVPVVANAIPPLTEFVRDGETGVLAPAERPDRLAAAVERVLADPDGARRMAERARAEVRDAFSDTAIAARYSRFLRSVM